MFFMLFCMVSLGVGCADSASPSDAVASCKTLFSLGYKTIYFLEYSLILLVMELPAKWIWTKLGYVPPVTRFACIISLLIPIYACYHSQIGEGRLTSYLISGLTGIKVVLYK